MAIAVPFLMSATGASAAIGAAVGISATMVSTITAVAFSVTGISAKINKAAAKVFGEDLVNVANIFGAGYAMFNGGFDVGGGGSEVIGPATDAAGNLTSAPEISSSMWDGIGEANTTAIESAAAGVEPMNLSDMAGGYDDGSFMADAVTPTETAGVNLKTGEYINGLDVDPKTGTATTDAPAATTTAPAGQGAAAQATPTATAQTAAGTSAAGANAAGTGAAGAKAAAGTTPNSSGNIFTRLFTNKDGSVNGRMVGAAMQGVGLVAQGIAQSSEAKKARDWQSQLYNARPAGIVRQ